MGVGQRRSQIPANAPLVSDYPARHTHAHNSDRTLPAPLCPCSLSQAIRLIDSGRFKGWRSSRAPGLAVSYYGLQVPANSA